MIVEDMKVDLQGDMKEFSALHDNLDSLPKKNEKKNKKIAGDWKNWWEMKL